MSIGIGHKGYNLKNCLILSDHFVQLFNILPDIHHVNAEGANNAVEALIRDNGHRRDIAILADIADNLIDEFLLQSCQHIITEEF